MRFSLQKLPFRMFDKVLKPIFKLFQTETYPNLDKDEGNSVPRKEMAILRFMSLLLKEFN